MPKLDNETILLVLVAVIGFAALLQAIILGALMIAVRKAARSIREETEKSRAAFMPILEDARDTVASTRDILVSAQAFLSSAQGFVSRAAPRIEAAAADLEEIVHGLRAQSEQMQFSAQEILERARRQSKRLDAMFSSFLDSVDRAGDFVTETVSRPVRQFSSVLRAAKAIVDALRTPPARRSPNPSAGEDRFV